MTHPIRDEQDLIQRVAAMRVRLDALKAENAALREYHAACERFFAQYSPRTWVGEGTYTSVIYARQRLATDHGLPLPEVER